MEHRCPQCASLHLTLIRERPFALEWRCDRCASVFVNPLVSVVIVDPRHDRRTALAALLEQEAIPVFAGTRLADLVAWPVGKVLVTDVSSLPRFETGATHVVVMADSESDREEAGDITGGRATIVNGAPETVLAALRGIAAVIAVAWSATDMPDRRTGLADRRRMTRRDRRS